MSDDQISPNDIQAALQETGEAVAVRASELADLAGGGTSGEPIGLDNLLEVPVRVTVQIGRTRMTLSQLVHMGPGSLIPLDREAHEPADILVNGKVVARGEVVTIDNTYGIRITSIYRED